MDLIYRLWNERIKSISEGSTLILKRETRNSFLPREEYHQFGLEVELYDPGGAEVWSPGSDQW